MSDDVKSRGLWSSRLMFILAAAGSAIGLGNIWRFPYLAGKYGGGAFVIMYLAFVAVLGIPVLVAEIMIGRESRKNPVGAFSKLSSGHKLWTAVGFMGVAAGFVILSYYSVIAGWTIDYFVKSVDGDYFKPGADIAGYFASLLADPYQQAIWHTAFMGATIAIVIFGIKEGLERWIGILMPALFLLLLLLVIYGLTAGDAKGGLSYLFVPDWSKLVTNTAGDYTPLPMLEALGQAFFSLSLGMGAMITYGSYLGDDASLPSSAVIIACLDTMIAILAGISIYTILFQYRLDPSAQGPGLVFKVLPLAFAQMPGGRILAMSFFALLFFAALTSAISLLEVVVAYFVDDRKWARRGATIVMGTIIWALGLFSAFSYNLLGSVTILTDKDGNGMPVLDSIDRVANNSMLPIGGFFIALFAGWFMNRDSVKKQLLEGGGSPLFFRIWLILIRFVSPLAIALLILFQLDSDVGILKRLFGMH